MHNQFCFYKMFLNTALVTIFTSLMLFSSTSTAQEIFTINTADKPPYSTSVNTGFYDVLVRSIFQKIGIEIKINHLPSARSLENVEVGLDDAEYARIKGLSAKHTNLRIVNEKLIDFSFTAFAKDSSIKIDGWESLKNYNIAFMRGWKIYESNVKDTRSEHVVSSEKELFKILLNDRVDIILYEKLRGYDFMKKNNVFGVVALESPLSVRGMYLYVNKNNEKLIPKLENVLQVMKQDGTYQKIVNSYMP